MQEIGRAYLVSGEKISETAYKILTRIFASVSIKAAYPSRNVAIFLLKRPDPTENLYRVVWLTRKEIWASEETADPEDALVLFEATLDLETGAEQE